MDNGLDLQVARLDLVGGSLFALRGIAPTLDPEQDTCHGRFGEGKSMVVIVAVAGAAHLTMLLLRQLKDRLDGLTDNLLGRLESGQLEEGFVGTDHGEGRHGLRHELRVVGNGYGFLEGDAVAERHVAGREQARRAGLRVRNQLPVVLRLGVVAAAAAAVRRICNTAGGGGGGGHGECMCHPILLTDRHVNLGILLQRVCHRSIFSFKRFRRHEIDLGNVNSLGAQARVALEDRGSQGRGDCDTAALLLVGSIIGVASGAIRGRRGGRRGATFFHEKLLGVIPNTSFNRSEGRGQFGIVGRVEGIVSLFARKVVRRSLEQPLLLSKKANHAGNALFRG